MNTLGLVRASRRHLSSAVSRAAATRAAAGGLVESECKSGCKQNRAYGSEADGAGVGVGVGGVRVDWSREEVKAVYEMPFLELIHRAAGVHRAHNDPSMVQYVLMMNGSFGRRWLVGWLVGRRGRIPDASCCLLASSLGVSSARALLPAAFRPGRPFILY